MFSHRLFLRGRQGRVAHNHNLPGSGITNRSVVVMTAAPVNLPGGIFGAPTVDQRLFVHGAPVWVTNIVPHGSDAETSGVEFLLQVDSDTPIDVAVTITVLDPLGDNDSTLV